jgi:hypothetical protein
MRQKPTRLDEFGKHLQVVIREMCERVGVDADKQLFNHNWFWTATWTKAEEDSFRDWLAEYVYNSAEARRELMAFPRRNKPYCKKLADEFVWQYGWKVSDET